VASRPPERIGPFLVEREIGRGGMGVVYLGRDPQLDRTVAIKVVPDEVAGDAERLGRFEREARLLAAVHHPNVATIFAVGMDAERPYLALEYVPGESLADRLCRGPLPLGEALEVCRQIAAGVESAHEAGVIHRDLKPANVRLSPEGAVKVLDFGLAKSDELRSTSASGGSAAPTLAFAETQEGVVLGTLPYMSPEQARGMAVDRRTDVWSLGCILYECLTGNGPFGGSSATDILAGIVLREPPWQTLPAETPSRVRELLRRCLEKERPRRLRDIGDARLELETALEERRSGASGVVAVPAPLAAGPRRRLAVVAGAAALAVAAGAAGWWLARSSGQGPVMRRLSVAFPQELRVEGGTLAADGSALVVLARPRGGSELDRRLYRRSLDSFELVPIPGTERVTSLIGPTPASSDGQVRFTVGRPGGEAEQQRYRVPLDGSAPPTLEGAWGEGWEGIALLEDGNFLVTARHGTSFFVMGAGDRAPAAPRRFVLPAPGELHATAPQGPGWMAMRYMRYTTTGFREGTAVLDLATGKAETILDQGRANALTEDGYLLFSRGSTLLAAPYDERARRITGPETGLLTGLRSEEAGLGGAFDLAADGTLAFPAGGPLDDRQLVACIPAGECEPWTALRRFFFMTGQPSPRDATVATVFAGRGDNYEIWRVDAAGALQPLVVLANRDVMSPVWSPDQRSLAYYSDAAGDSEDGTWLHRLDGSEPRPLAVRSRVWPALWMSDGRLVLGKGVLGDPINDILVLDVERGGEPRPLIATSFRESPLDLAPDGKRLAFLSDHSGVFEIYLAELRADGGAGEPVPLSRGRATWGRFAPDGRSFYFANDSGAVLRVAIGADGAPSAAEPEPVVDLDDERLLSFFSMLPDGRLLFLRQATGEGEIDRFEIVLGFADEVRRRLRAGNLP
jgi:hypothetical protein